MQKGGNNSLLFIFFHTATLSIPLISSQKLNGVMIKYISLTLLLLLSASRVYSQKMAVATNGADYLNLFTINGGFSFALSRSVTMEWSMRYNPFVYNLSGSRKEIQNKRLALYTGVRYWPWHVYSGWFIMGNLNFTRFNMGGIFSMKSYEGDAYALTFGGGYALMLSSKFNLDFAFSFMTGYSRYKRYGCTSCGPVEAKKKQLFITPDNIYIQLSYLF